MTHTLVLFLLLFESRYSIKKTLVITGITMIPLIGANTALFFFLDPNVMGTIILLSLSLPSLIVFWILAKNRDGRFFFTFCFVDTVVLEVIYTTQIIDFFLTPENNISMFILRLIILPLLEWLTFKKLRLKYIDVQRKTKNGWTVFAIVGGLFYILMTLSVTQPTAITSRLEYLPSVILLFILIPVIYINIITTLRQQQKMYEMMEQKNIVHLQVHNMTNRIEELAAADERFREERHNYRHKMKTIASLIETKQYEELASLVEDYNETYQKTQVIRYCQNAIIDAVLSTYIKNAKSKGIEVKVGFAFPNPIPVDATELATVFANALENAIHACEKLEPEKRLIDIKVLSRPRFMIQIANSFNGVIEFDENGIPVNREEGHGIGTRSIVAFCKMNHAHYLFKAENEKFTMFLNF